MRVHVNHLETPEKIEVTNEFPGTPRTLVFGDDIVDGRDKWDDEKSDDPWWKRGVWGCPYVVLVFWCCGMIVGAILVILLLAVGVQNNNSNSNMAAISKGNDDYYFSDVGGDTGNNNNSPPSDDTLVEAREFTVEGYELRASEVQRMEDDGMNTRWIVTGDVEMPFGNFDMTLIGVELELQKSQANERMLDEEGSGSGSGSSDDGSIFDLINRASIQGIMGSSPVFKALGPLLSGEINRTLHMSFRYASEIPFLGDVFDLGILRQEQRFMCIMLQNETFDDIQPYDRNYWLAQQYKLRNEHWLARSPQSWLVISDQIPALLVRTDNLFPPTGIWNASAAVLPSRYNPRDIRWNNVTVQLDQGLLGISDLEHLYLDPFSLFGSDLYQALTSDTIYGNSYLFGTMSLGLDVFADTLLSDKDDDRRPVRLALEGAIQAVADVDYEMLSANRNMAYMPRESLRSVAANSDIIFRLDDQGLFSSFCHLASATFHLYDHNSIISSAARGNGTTLALSGNGPQPDNCEIGGLWNLFRIPESLRLDFQIYSHMIVTDIEDVLDVPPLVLAGQGNVFLKIINYEWELSDFKFEFIPSDLSISVSGILKLPVTLFGTTRLVSMQGLLDSSNSSTINGGLDFNVKNPVTGSTFNGTIDMDILRSNPIVDAINPIPLAGNPISLAGRQVNLPLYELVSVAHFDYCPFGDTNRCRFMSIVVDITKGGFFNLCTDVFSEEGELCLDITNLGIFKTGVECLVSMECESGRCDGFVCKDRLEDGSACNENTDCLSRRCEGFVPGITAGTCRQKAGIGAFCNENTDCERGRCAVAQCRAGEPGDLCELDSDCDSKRCVMFQCSAGEIDDPCEFNSDCVTTGRCYWNLDAIVPQGVCRQKLSDGSTCIENSECSSNRCVAFQCVAGNNGDLCLLNSHCESGRCDGFPIPKCKRKLERGSPCIHNSDCVSNRCKFGFLGSTCK